MKKLFGLLVLCFLGAQAHSGKEQKWVNPGGMWPPNLIGQQETLLNDLGLEISAKDLSDPSSNVLQAVVSLGYCSGSFVSNDGLIVTNHHCVRGMLSHLSNEDRQNPDLFNVDYVKNGFHAEEKTLERHAGPSERIYVTTLVQDVTEEMLEGTANILDPLKKALILEQNEKKLIAQAEAKDKNYKAKISSFYRDESFMLSLSLELKDVRVVFAPSSSIGNFGGDTDNWNWPRHTGDFAFIRAYVGPDGQSREYHPDNIPYKPANILPLAQSFASYVKKDDLVLVAGYPGSTDRLDTATEVADEIQRSIPFLLEKYSGFRQVLSQLSQDEKLRVKLESRISSLDNFLKNRENALKALHAVKYLETKQFEEENFISWMGSSEKLGEMDRLHESLLRGWEKRAFESDLMVGMSAGLVHLISSAIEIARMAEERPKNDEDRHPDYQERKWQQWLNHEDSAQLKYDETIAKTVLAWVLNRAIASDDEKIPQAIKLMINVEAARQNSQVIDSAIENLFATTTLVDLNQRKELFLNATMADLKSSEDPIIRLALVLLPEFHNLENEYRIRRGSYLEASNAYIKALRAYKASEGELLCPDANSTLRITFGHCLGYHKPSTGDFQHPFTYAPELLAKHQEGDKEFHVPEKIRALIEEQNFEPFIEPIANSTPINFLAAVDTTGGNSGSAALNKKGELIGLLFDGNSDALHADWKFEEEIVRSILVDIRYVLWVLQKVYGAENLLLEMGISAK